MKILFLNNGGGGFADYVDTAEGTNIEAFLKEQVSGYKPGDCDWAVMAILTCGGQTYARLRFGVGPGAQVLIPVQVDFSVPFPGADHEAWSDEFQRNIMPAPEPALRQLSEQTVAAADRGEGRKHARRRERHIGWQVPDTDELHELRDAEALADLEAELAARGYFDEEMPFDTR